MKRWRLLEKRKRDNKVTIDHIINIKNQHIELQKTVSGNQDSLLHLYEIIGRKL